jgi:hypothetical protein
MSRRTVEDITKHEKPTWPGLRERDVDSGRHQGQDDAQDQEFPQDLSSLRLHRVALLQDVEAGVEPAGGQEILVGACLCDAAALDHEDLVHVSNQP